MDRGIMIGSDTATNEDAAWLSKTIGRRIEHELGYPGQIKVPVIRESRAADYTK